MSPSTCAAHAVIILICVNILKCRARYIFDCSTTTPTANCSDNIIDCPSNQDCRIECLGVDSCSNSIINCPQSSKCVIHCFGEGSCQDAVVNGTFSEEVSIFTMGYASGPDIYCPNLDTHDANRYYGCQLYGNGTDLQYINTDWYVEGGDWDITIDCQDKSYPCIQNVTLFSESDYSESCIIDGINDSHHCLWIYYNYYGPYDYDYHNYMYMYSTTAPSTSTTNVIMRAGPKKNRNDDGDSNQITIYISVAVGVSFMFLCGIALAVFFHKKTKKIQSELEKVRSQSEAAWIDDTMATPGHRHVKTTSAPDEDNEDPDTEIIATPDDATTDFKDEVHKWLKSIDLEEYYDNFASNGYKNIKFILQISDEDDLKELGITLKGHQKMILNGIANLQEGNGYDVKYADTPEHDLDDDEKMEQYTEDVAHVQRQTLAPGNSSHGHGFEGHGQVMVTGGGEKTPRSTALFIGRTTTHDHEDMYDVVDAMMDGDNETQTGALQPLPDSPLSKPMMEMDLISQSDMKLNMSASPRATEVLDATLVEVLRMPTIPNSQIQQNELLKLDDIESEVP